MGHLLGYARASTVDQQPHLQVDAWSAPAATGCSPRPPAAPTATGPPSSSCWTSCAPATPWWSGSSTGSAGRCPTWSTPSPDLPSVASRLAACRGRSTPTLAASFVFHVLATLAQHMPGSAEPMAACTWRAVLPSGSRPSCTSRDPTSTTGWCATRIRIRQPGLVVHPPAEVDLLGRRPAEVRATQTSGVRATRGAGPVSRRLAHLGSTPRGVVKHWVWNLPRAGMPPASVQTPEGMAP
jgi:hypothetical protein